MMAKGEGKIMAGGQPPVQKQAQMQAPTQGQSMYRSMALFLDGMSRVALFPFGPSLVARLLLKGGTITKLQLEHCSLIAFPLAAVVATYCLGRSFGHCVMAPACFGRSQPSETTLSKLVPRLSGIVIALHVLTFGAGLPSVWILAVLRFVSAALVGMLCRITKNDDNLSSVAEGGGARNLPGAQAITARNKLDRDDIFNDSIRSTHDDEWLEAGIQKPSALDAGEASHDECNDGTVHQRGRYVDTTPGTAKVYLTALAVSILSGGLLFRHATTDVTFQHLTGQHASLTPIFMLVVAGSTECIFRLFIWSCARRNGENLPHKSLRMTSSQPSASDRKPLLRESFHDATASSQLLAKMPKPAPRSSMTKRQSSISNSSLQLTFDLDCENPPDQKADHHDIAKQQKQQYHQQQQQQQQQQQDDQQQHVDQTLPRLEPPSHLPAIDFKAMRPMQRQRLDSTASFKSATPIPLRERSMTTDSEFFDCNSVLSDMEDMDLFYDDAGNDDKANDDDEQAGHQAPSTGSSIGAAENGIFNATASYVDHQCVYDDGHPAFVPAGDSVARIPPNYMEFCGGNEAKARKMWQATQKWRHEWDVWRIHRKPNTWFREIKNAYPHTVHGYSKAGYPIIYEQPGRMNLKELFSNGCKIRDMANHLVFFMEFIAHHIAVRDDIRAKRGPEPGAHNSSSWGTMVVMDVQGVGISHLSGDVLRYLKTAGDINGNHYPMTMRRAFLVNSPFWLAGTWSTVKGILPESVQVDILSSSKYLDALREYIDDDQIPPEYGGSSPYRLGEHPFELALQDFVDQASELPSSLEPVAGPLDVTSNQNANAGSNAGARPDAAEGMNDVDDITAGGMTSIPWGDDDGQVTKADASTMDVWDEPRSASSANHSFNPSTPLRRRNGSFSIEQEMAKAYVGLDDSRDVGGREHDVSVSDFYDGNKGIGYEGERDIFVIVSVMFTLFSTSQGIIETAIPFWIVTPTRLGGLGYAPSRSGVSMFCSAMVLLWVMRTKWSRVVPQIPVQEPMRSFRIGAGSQSVLLLLIALVPRTAIPSKRTDSILVMTFTIIMISCMILSGIFGRSSSTILHRIAADRFGTLASRKNPGWGRWHQSGGATRALSLCGEVLGVLLVGITSTWSLSQARPAPFDGTSCLYLASLLTFVLYVCSFSLHLNGSGHFSQHPRERDGCSEAGARRCSSFICEVATVSLGDMASLFEETNWAYSSLLSHPRFHSQMVEKGGVQCKTV